MYNRSEQQAPSLGRPRRRQAPKGQGELAKALLGRFLEHLQDWRRAFKQQRTYRRALETSIALIASSGRSTLTNAITLLGDEQQDWTSAYRVFNKSDWSIRDLFRPVIQKAVRNLQPNAPVVIALDDTCLPKAGPRIPQASYCHNPLAPKFLLQRLQWGIRMIHAALLLPDYVVVPEKCCWCRFGEGFRELRSICVHQNGEI